MKKLLITILAVGCILTAPAAKAQLRADARPQLSFGTSETSEWATDLDLMDSRKKRKKRRKRRKKNTFAIGAVAGAPVGFGGRVVFRPTRLGVAADIAYNRLRTDNGPLVGALTTKLDARFYSKGLIAKLLRIYSFAGMTMQRGEFDEEKMQSVYAMDAGLGAGIKLFRMEINAEVGLLIPVHGVEAYQPRFSAFGNVGVLLWLF